MLFVILTALGARVQIPIPGTPVPMTLQTLPVFAAPFILGGWLGTVSMLLYYVLGLIGLPVFASDAGGAGAALSASAGYVFGFILAQYPAAAAWRLVGKGRTGRLWTWAGTTASVVAANVVIFGVGLVWLHAYLNTSWSETLAKGLWPFLAGDAIKSASAIVIGVLATRAGMSRV